MCNQNGVTPYSINLQHSFFLRTDLLNEFNQKDWQMAGCSMKTKELWLQLQRVLEPV